MFACSNTSKEGKGKQAFDPQSEVEDISIEPYARYWWFASEIKREDIRWNLDWLKKNGFGGVELAWVYPLNAKNNALDSTYTPRQEWLSPEWQEIVRYAIHYADSIGLACDLTMGTLWPFGDSRVSYAEASKRYGEDERQMITRSWEYPEKAYVVDHLDPRYYLKYFERMTDSFPYVETQQPQAYFIDSWEVETDKLWFDGFEKKFYKRYGYDIIPFMDSLYGEGSQDVMYDYRKLISEKAIRFYADFDSVLNRNGILSRGQCSGAPCDIISAYARLDIPEGEAMLYEPEFNSIPASAALLSGSSVVSAESFTCLYGWPDHYLREEQSADLKMVADALFANGVNKIIWHGKAHNPDRQDLVSFYATVHLGPEGTLAAELPEFNDYLSKVSRFMRSGKTYSDVAVYLPSEDAWIKGIMPKAQQFIWAREYYEMRYVYFPREVRGHNPLWINREFLERSEWDGHHLKSGGGDFSSLYIDAMYLDLGVLKRVYDLAVEGLPVTLKRLPLQAGKKKHPDWDDLVKKLTALPNVDSVFKPRRNALVRAEEVLAYWARETDESLRVFFAHPKSRRLKFPIAYGASLTEKNIEIPAMLSYEGKEYAIDLLFEPYQSLLFEIRDGSISEIDISYQPPTPHTDDCTEGIETPWLVE